MSKKHEIADFVTGLVALIAVAVFMVLGFTVKAWHLNWIVFLAIPITAIIMDIVVKKKKDISGLVTGLVALIAVAVFIVLGFATKAWYLIWIVFLAIPITAIVINIVKAAKKDKESEEENKSPEKL